MELTTLIELYGPPGAIIFGLGWAYLAERKERKDAQTSEKETLMQVLPAVSALEKALTYIERSGK